MATSPSPFLMLRSCGRQPYSQQASPSALLLELGHTMSLLAGKKVLLTGASRGIGAAIACAAAKEGASLTLVAHPHHEEDLKQVGGLPWTSG